MPDAICIIEGKEYKLQYHEIFLKNGIKITGTVFLETPLHFSFVDFDAAKYKLMPAADVEKMICNKIITLLIKESKEHQNN